MQIKFSAITESISNFPESKTLLEKNLQLTNTQITTDQFSC